MAGPLSNITSFNFNYDDIERSAASYMDEFMRMEAERMLYGNKPTAKEMADTVVNMYIDRVYQVNYINEIFRILDEDIQNFTFCKSFSPDSEPKPKYHLIVNEKLTIRILSIDDIFNISAIICNIDKKEKIWYMDMVPEAREKIESKYIQYISRLEDKFGRSIHDILSIE